jgi:alpha-mannosidase
MAARLCDEYPGFIFNHNETILYQWVEVHEPDLFKKIQSLVEQKRWYIMGGWYLQPDCNLPSGESFIRQILIGKHYIKKKFNIEPHIAVNVDSFGHTRGLVQILKKAGYTSYLFCRPDKKSLDLPGDSFIWVGYDGSEIMAHRASDHYNSQKGKAGDKVEEWIKDHEIQNNGLLLWGIGNHGGGPSREDLTRINNIIKLDTGWIIGHGRPEDYFEKLKESKKPLPKVSQDLNPWAVGCYTTMASIKQGHRSIENIYFLTEKMVCLAMMHGLMKYPENDLRTAIEDLLYCEFHDILAGTSIKEVENDCLRRLDHGLEKLARLKAEAFFKLLSGQKEADEGEYPIFIYNPHPYDLETTMVCELQPPEPNFDKSSFLQPEIKDQNGIPIPFQLEKESCNILTDQRKRIVFNTHLHPASMNRLSCKLNPVPLSDKPKRDTSRSLIFKSNRGELKINKATGLIDRLRIEDIDYLKSSAMQLLVIKDYPDPWGMKVSGFPDVLGKFQLMSPEESAIFSGISSPFLQPVRIIEEGSVRTVVEALFKYNISTLCLRYTIPKEVNEIQIQLRIYWMEKDKMLKLSIPTPFKRGLCKGQVAYGVQEFTHSREEQVAQRWIALFSSDQKYALTIINDSTYGFDYGAGELRVSLLRSAAYAGHPVEGQSYIVRQDRFEPRIDQGERVFNFWLQGGCSEERYLNIHREAQAKNEPPMVLCCFPPGSGKLPIEGITISDPAVQLTALKKAVEKNWIIFRLFESTGEERTTCLRIPIVDKEFNITMKGFEIKTFGLDLKSKEIFRLDLMERKINI